MEAEVTIFFYPAMSAFEADGSLVMRVCSYDKTSHSSGEHHVLLDDPDFALWCCLRDSFLANLPSIPFITGEKLPAIRAEFLRSRTLA